MRKVHQKFMIGVRLFEEGHMVQALALAEELIRSEDEMDRLDGYSCRGMFFEDGGLDVAVDLGTSIDGYRRASLITPNAVASQHLARVTLKRKELSQSLRFLEISARYDGLFSALFATHLLFAVVRVLGPHRTVRCANVAAHESVASGSCN